MNTIQSNLSKNRQRSKRHKKKAKTKRKSNRLKRYVKKKSKRQNRRRRRRKQSGGDALPMQSFIKGTKFYKGSLRYSCDSVLKHHTGLRACGAGVGAGAKRCLNGTSIWLGPNEERSKKYWIADKNWWNVFELKEDLQVLHMNPALWDRGKINQLIQEAKDKLGSADELEEQLLDLPHLGKLLEIRAHRNFTQRLEDMCCMIFGIDSTVQQQKSYLKECLQSGNEMDKTPDGGHAFTNKKEDGYMWTATPSLVKQGTTTFYHYLLHYISRMDSYKDEELQWKNQRLSYLGFDTIFLSLVCRAGYVGYYFPDVKSIHEDAGEELAIFETLKYLECNPEESHTPIMWV